jgi:hypothetical protein
MATLDCLAGQFQFVAQAAPAVEPGVRYKTCPVCPRVSPDLFNGWPWLPQRDPVPRPDCPAPVLDCVSWSLDPA